GMHANGLTDFFAKNADLLGKESGDKGGNANPQRALDSAGYFASAAQTMLNTHVEMLVELGNLKQMWTGPAAKAFTDAYKPIMLYVHDAAKNLAPVGSGSPLDEVGYRAGGGWRGAVEAIGNVHAQAIGMHNLHYNIAINEYTRLVNAANAENLGYMARVLEDP